MVTDRKMQMLHITTMQWNNKSGHKLLQGLFLSNDARFFAVPRQQMHFMQVYNLQPLEKSEKSTKYI